jgi:hypothetical protein
LDRFHVRWLADAPGNKKSAEGEVDPFSGEEAIPGLTQPPLRSSINFDFNRRRPVTLAR